MKPLYTISLATLAAVTLSLGSCHKADNYVDNSIAFSRVQYRQAYNLKGSATDYGHERDLTYGTEADLLMPTALYGHDVNTLADTIMSRAFGKFGDAHLDIIKESLRADAASLDYALADTVLPDTLTARYNFLSCVDGFSAVQGDVETLTPEVLSLALTMSAYLPGAAHGNYGTIYVNYDIDEGRIIELGDIISADALPDVLERVKDIARTMEPVTGPTDIDALPAGDNFYITASNEIVFSYQPYEVASYAQGEIQIPVPAYLIASSLTPLGNKLLLN